MLSCQGWLRCSLQLCWLCIIIFLKIQQARHLVKYYQTIHSWTECLAHVNYSSLHLSRPTTLFAGKVATGTVIGSFLGEVVHLSFCFSDERVAACSGAAVHVLSSKVQGDAHFHSCA